MFKSREIMSTNFSNIGITQRDQFRRFSEDTEPHVATLTAKARPYGFSSDETSPKEFWEPPRTNPDGDEQIPDSKVQDEPSMKEKEKMRCMWLKYILFVVVVSGLLTGVIAVVVVFKEQDSLPEKLGGILPEDQNPFVECPDVPVFVGQSIKIICNFTQNNNMISNWERLKGVGNGGDTIETHSTYQPVANKAKSMLLCSKGKGYIVTCEIDDGASCANQGEVEISFIDRNYYNFYTASLYLYVNDKGQDTVQVNPIISGNETSFHLTCAVVDVCKFYKMRFMANGERVDGSTMKCSSSYSGQGGYSITCSDIVGVDQIKKATSSLTCQTYDEAKPNEYKVELSFEIKRCCDFFRGDEDLCQDKFRDSCDVPNNCTGICDFFTRCVGKAYKYSSNNSTDCDENCVTFAR
ncbi:hypothetical protein MAR_014281 [Mya arenaria]|uniref:Uncharacterized protein n=1 Tax=Mya arenaria TaxID=6604 RepID=A0ABY7G3W1_MYAAR|nr:hypothetical protein MAR_014281 [Mya arenaria]